MSAVRMLQPLGGFRVTSHAFGSADSPHDVEACPSRPPTELMACTEIMPSPPAELA